MSTVRQQAGSTAFRPGTPIYGAALPRRERAAPAPAAQPRARVQEKWLLLLVTIAAIGCVLGLLYLSAYAQLTREGYRRVELLAKLRAEQEQSTQFQQIEARLSAPESIEAQSRRLGMTPGQPSQAVVIESEH